MYFTMASSDLLAMTLPFREIFQSWSESGAEVKVNAGSIAAPPPLSLSLSLTGGVGRGFFLSYLEKSKDEALNMLGRE